MVRLGDLEELAILFLFFLPLPLWGEGVIYIDALVRRRRQAFYKAAVKVEPGKHE